MFWSITAGASQRVIELAGKLAHEIEWLYSGDISEETFMKRFKEITDPILSD